ncbi:MAG: hypothetical protein ACEQSR_07285 [Candidatus Methylacidiphilales bacterium]
MIKNLKIFLVCFGLLFLTQNVFSQKVARWSTDLSLGVPVTFFSVNSNIMGIYQLGLRYSINKNWSVAGRFDSKSFFAKTGNAPGIVSPDGVYAKDLISYKNEFYGLSGYAQYNLSDLLGLTKTTNRFMPFAVFGAGLQFWKLKSSLIDGKSSAMSEYGGKPMRNYQLGLGLRYYVNPSLDFLITSEYNYVESYWLDGAYGDKKLDTYLNTSLGVSYKIGATASKNLAEWSFKNTSESNEPAKNYSRWSADLNVGLPIMFSSIGYSPTLMAGIAGRYSFSNFFSLQGNYHLGQFSGSQDLSANAPGGKFDASFIKEYTNTMNQFTLRALFNLRRVNSEPDNLNKWNYYASVGGGYLFYNINNTYADNTKSEFSYNEGVQNIVVGMQARKHINSSWDFITGLDFNYNQSKWLDGAGNQANQNHHIYVNTGISYKFASSNKRELIDWSYSNYNYSKQPKDVAIDKIPVIDKPKVIDEPKVVVEPKEIPKLINEQPKVEPIVEPVVTPKVDPVTPKVEPKVDTNTEPKVKPKPTPTEEVEMKDEVTEPDGKYNIVVGCYGLSHLDLAMKYRDSIRKKGFKANVYRSIGSKYYRVMTTSTSDKQSALRILKRSKVEVDPQSWFYLYNKQ